MRLEGVVLAAILHVLDISSIIHYRLFFFEMLMKLYERDLSKFSKSMLNRFIQSGEVEVEHFRSDVYVSSEGTRTAFEIW